MASVKQSPVLQFLCLLLFVASSEAGRRQIRPRNNIKLLGGNEISNGTHPFLVSVRLMPRELHRCGGFLISHRHIITTASCVFGVLDRKLYAYVNALRLDEEGHYYEIGNATIHPKFGLTPRVNDIAVLHLKNSIAQKYISPLNVDSRFTLPPQETPVFVYGWGYRNQNMPVKDASYFRLHYLEQKIKSTALCSLTDGEIYGCETLCIGGSNFSSERVDIGTPVVFSGKKKYAIGMLVKSISREVRVAPYMNLMEYAVWIEDIVAKKGKQEQDDHGAGNYSESSSHEITYIFNSGGEGDTDYEDNDHHHHNDHGEDSEGSESHESSEGDTYDSSDDTKDGDGDDRTPNEDDSHDYDDDDGDGDKNSNSMTEAMMTDETTTREPETTKHGRVKVGKGKRIARKKPKARNTDDARKLGLKHTR